MEDQDPDLVPTQPAGSQAAETGNPPEQHKDAEPKPSEEENEKQPEAGPSTAGGDFPGGCPVHEVSSFFQDLSFGVVVNLQPQDFKKKESFCGRISL